MPLLWGHFLFLSLNDSVKFANKRKSRNFAKVKYYFVCIETDNQRLMYNNN